MSSRTFALFPRVSQRLEGWVVVGWCWLAHVLALAVLIGFRGVKTSGIAQTFEFDDVPLLRQLDHHYSWVFLGAALTGGVVLLFAAGSYWTLRKTSHRFPSSLLLGCGLTFTVGLFACRYLPLEPDPGFAIEPVGLADWLSLLLGVWSAWSLSKWLGEEFLPPEPFSADQPAARENRLVRLSGIYLLGCALVAVYAFHEHGKFWDPAKNGGFDYRPFFQPDEVAQADLVFFSTSLLLASLAALGGCVLYGVFHWLSRTKRTGEFPRQVAVCRRHAAASALFWSALLTVPWQIKILPEIVANDGWILPGVSLGFGTAGLLPLIMVSSLLLRGDFDRSFRREIDNLAPETQTPPFRPRGSESAFWNLLLFPVYPFLKMVCPARCSSRVRAGGLMVLTALVIAVLTWVFQKADQLFDFDDWRGMLEAGLFPCLQVMMSLMAAGWLYLTGVRAANWLSRLASRESSTSGRPWMNAVGSLVRLSVVALALATLTLASWPFWGWRHVHENVFARAVEFNNRHEFELRFLHWLFDADRDGYAAVLHGADPDDVNPAIQAGGLSAPRTVAVPIDEFEIVDPGKAAQLPNVAIFYLEGVTCRAISAYGQRQLPNGLAATPYIDSIAREGTRFTEARCFYPSTWDGWFAVSSGRYLRIAEMHAGQSFGDRYSRYNNLYKVLELAGINRWCHADTSPYFDLLVPNKLRQQEATAWKSGEDYSSAVSPEEETDGLWRGDKRAERILGFLDSLKPDERFFFCEHMSDTHFPWERTPDERAAELGFPEGLDIYEADAVLPNGGTHNKYSCYLQTITRMDAQIGLILNKLKEKNLYDNTLVVIVSDHGCQWYEHEHVYYVSHLYEQSLHVPLIIKVPGLPGGQVSEAPVIQIDVLPTIAELAGIRQANPTPDYPMTCQSLVPILKGDKDHSPERYRERDMLLCTHYDMLGVISNFEHKLIFDRPTGTFLVFDLKNDPGETRNLADSRPDLLASLLSKLRRLTERHASFIGQIQASTPN